jgi:ATP-dependent RNA helicase DeaD
METSPGRPIAALERTLAARGWRALTAVQRAVLDPDARGADLLVSAPTGSGKTVAFGLALADHLASTDGSFAPWPSPCAVVVVPTRELARQVGGELGWLLGGLGARVGVCTGGADPRAERALLERGLDVVVGTAGRLRDHVTRRSLATDAVACVVLDEADDMLGRGFRPDIEFILGAMPDGRRTLMFSATVTPDVERLAARHQRDARRLVLGGGVVAAGLTGVVVADDEREAAVANLLRLHEAPSALVFCSRRDSVGGLARGLLARGFRAVALSGALDQAERDAAIAAMRRGQARVCVATDVAARGLDLPGLDLVIHADLPSSPQALLHRSGRSGRAGTPGTVVLVVARSERRRASRLAGRAGLALDWAALPGPEAVRVRDLERLMEYCATNIPTPQDAAAAASALCATRAPEAIVAALVRFWLASNPVTQPLSGSR